MAESVLTGVASSNPVWVGYFLAFLLVQYVRSCVKGWKHV